MAVFKWIIGSLSNREGNQEDNVDWHMNLYLRCNSLNPLKLFIGTVFLIVKTITKLNLEHDQFEKEIEIK